MWTPLSLVASTEKRRVPLRDNAVERWAPPVSREPACDRQAHRALVPVIGCTASSHDCHRGTPERCRQLPGSGRRRRTAQSRWRNVHRSLQSRQPQPQCRTCSPPPISAASKPSCHRGARTGKLAQSSADPVPARAPVLSLDDAQAGLQDQLSERQDLRRQRRAVAVNRSSIGE
jgi:hypothetical protein